MGIQTILRDKEKEINEILFNNSLNVRRKISAGGPNQGAFLSQDCANGVNNGRRASEDNLDDNGTLGWLIEFGMVDHNSRNVDQETKLLKVPNFKQNQTTSQRRSFDEKNKEVSVSIFGQKLIINTM